MRSAISLLALWLALPCDTGSLGAETPPSELAAVLQRLETGEPVRIVCFGDSITGAYYHTGGVRAWCDMLGIALERTYPKARVEIVNAGISGNTTVQGLSRIDKDVLDKQPHLVVVMFGMNDVARLPLKEFAANLQQNRREVPRRGSDGRAMHAERRGRELSTAEQQAGRAGRASQASRAGTEGARRGLLCRLSTAA